MREHLRAGRNTHLRAKPIRILRWRRRLLRSGGLALGLVGIGLLAAACGGGSGSSGAGAGSTSTTSPGASTNSNVATGGSAAQGSGTAVGFDGITVQFSQCMRGHGVPNFADPNSQGEVVVHGIDPNSPQFLAAQTACAKYGLNGGMKPTSAESASVLAHLLKFSKCMRSQGITDFPDPTNGPNGIGMIINSNASNLQPNNPQFKAAEAACQKFMPGGESGNSITPPR